MAVYTPTVGSPVTFKLQMSAPGIDGSAMVDDRHIPGGDYNYIDLGGQTLNTWEAEAMFSSYTDFQSMLALSGSQGTLDYVEDVPSIATNVTLNVVVRKVSRKKITGRGAHFASLSLLILS